MLLDEVVTKADSASDSAKDLPLDSPFQKVGRARREVASPSEAAVSEFLKHHEPPTLAQPQDQPKDQPNDQPNDQPTDQPGDQATEHPPYPLSNYPIEARTHSCATFV